jgi:hypothetical protein
MDGLLAPMTAVGALRHGATLVWTRGAFAVVVIWAIVATLALVVVAPAWAWWSGALGHTIDGARLLGSPNLGTLTELLRDQPFGARTIMLAALAGAGIALVLNPFLAGGLIGALVRDPADLAHAYGGRVTHFAADGVRFYGPLLRVGLIAWPIAAVIVTGAALLVAIPFAGSSTPALSLAASGAVVAIGTMVAAMLVDLARIHVVRTDVPRAGAAVIAALAIIGRQAWPLLAVAVVFATAFALAGVALFAVRGWLSGETWPSILLLVAVQQAHAFARTWLRATLIASEDGLVAADAEARIRARALAASIAAVEERPEVFVVVQGEAGEGGLAGDEGRGGGDLAPEIPGRLAAEGDGGRRDADAEEARPAQPALASDRRGDEPPPVA